MIAERCRQTIMIRDLRGAKYRCGADTNAVTADNGDPGRLLNFKNKGQSLPVDQVAEDDPNMGAGKSHEF
ncbi:hypothetical protein AC629_42235 [Bradyrhizobium sp. NAS80.1]|uniref:hypothetical protein n=1 Tax=Bradyrhizobium sp. NAS80.1 TaxID=1680159 RepID=UPI0009659091|nr:hypothetical protein [Bradyrhizobium sp. NAS80.1]OKO68258.1 hypothetical protein AC629_42235 [Bradyrhizobium sp. NAS80.1]